jgi:CHAD domain-containing protein
MTNQQPELTSHKDFIVLAIQKNLADFLAEMDGVIANQDMEYVHRQRISLRRLRNNLQLFRPYGNESFRILLLGLQNQTSSYALMLANARDLDIQLSLSAQLFQDSIIPGVDNFMAIVHDNRQLLQYSMVKHLEEVDYLKVFAVFLHDLQDNYSKHLLTEPQVVNAVPPRTICGLTSLALGQLYLLDAQSEFVELHRFRKIIRRLRYTLECYSTRFPMDLQSAIETFHQIQDQLGFLHDLDMLHLSINQYQSMIIMDKIAMERILQAARIPHNTAFIAASQTGGFMIFLQNLLNQFNQKLLLETEPSVL